MHPAAQLRAHAALAQPDAQVDLLGPEVLGPDVPVHLIQVVAPAGTAVGGGVQAGGPLRGRVGPVRDTQVDLGVRHPDRGQRDGDVGGQGLPLQRRGELVRQGRQPVVRPGVGLGEQDPVVEVAHRQPVALCRPGAHRPCLPRLAGARRAFGGGRPAPRPRRTPGAGLCKPGPRRGRAAASPARAVVLPELVIPRHPDDGAATAADDGLGLLDVGHAAPAHPVDDRDRPAAQLGVARARPATPSSSRSPGPRPRWPARPARAGRRWTAPAPRRTRRGRPA